MNLTGMQYAGNSSFSIDPDVLVRGQSFDINWAGTGSGIDYAPVNIDYFY